MIIRLSDALDVWHIMEIVQIESAKVISPLSLLSENIVLKTNHWGLSDLNGRLLSLGYLEDFFKGS